MKTGVCRALQPQEQTYDTVIAQLNQLILGPPVTFTPSLSATSAAGPCTPPPERPPDMSKVGAQRGGLLRDNEGFDCPLLCGRNATGSTINNQV